MKDEAFTEGARFYDAAKKRAEGEKLEILVGEEDATADEFGDTKGVKMITDEYGDTNYILSSS
jgi:hypothetical protein